MSDRTVSVLRTHDDRVIPSAGVYDIDGAHTSVEFVGRHLMITKIRGRFSDGADISPIGDERIGFSAATDVNREDFGLSWNMALETGGLLVGKTARIELAVQAIAKSQAAVA